MIFNYDGGGVVAFYFGTPPLTIKQRYNPSYLESNGTDMNLNGMTSLLLHLWFTTYVAGLQLQMKSN